MTPLERTARLLRAEHMRTHSVFTYLPWDRLQASEKEHWLMRARAAEEADRGAR